jgi:hypothetical protein
MPSIDENRRRWNEEHDWSRRGEDWTPDEIWRTEVIKYGIEPYLRAGMHVLEIGPGGGAGPPAPPAFDLGRGRPLGEVRRALP